MTSGGTFTNTANATFAPGSSPGDLTIENDFDLGSSTITFEVSGNTPATEYDQILHTSTSETITISGASLHVSWGSYSPMIGDTYTIIGGFENVTGTFASAASLTPDVEFTVNYTPTAVEVEVTNVLPVELVHFSGEQTKRGVALKWITASEINNAGFEIQRSDNGTDWPKIGHVNGNGDSNELLHYSYLDKAPAYGLNYYQFKQNDFDGAFEYSDVLSAIF